MPFEPGKSGNPTGERTHKDVAGEAARKILDELIKVGKGKNAQTVRIIEAGFRRMAQLWYRQGSEKAGRLLLAYGYGLPPQPMEHAGKGGDPITFLIGELDVTGEGGKKDDEGGDG